MRECKHSDYQRSKVYAWEQAAPKAYGKPVITFERAQMFVNGVWLSLGLIGPPVVEPISKRCTATMARGCRPYIELPEQCPAWVILHELSHSLTMDYDGHGSVNAHGPKFVATFIKLLTKVLDVPLPLLLYSAKVHGVKHELPYN